MTKLGRFREAHQQFDVGFKLAKYPTEKNFLLNRRAAAYLEEYKGHKKPTLLEGCIASLLGALSQGNSYYAALIALDAFKSADFKVWEDLIRKKYKVHDLMWKCAAVLCEDPRQISSAFTLMSAFPMPSVTPFLKEKDFLKILSTQQRVDLPLAIFSGWHLLQKEAQPWSFENAAQVLAIYSRLRDSARLLLSKQLFFLSALYARNAWAQSHQVDSTFEATVLYASVLAQMGNFEELEKWGKTAWQYMKKRNSISFLYLMNAFCDHHHIGQQRTRIGARGNCSTIYTVTVEDVREEFGHAKMLFSDAGQDPYWRKILTHYFPGEDFSKRT